MKYELTALLDVEQTRTMCEVYMYHDKYGGIFPAVKEGSLRRVKKIIRSGVDINIKDSEGITPLMEACRNKEVRIVKFLLSNGADINARSEKGDTALWWAARERHLRIVKLLLESGADTDLQHNNGMTPLMMYASCGDRKEVIRLLEGGELYTLEIKDNYGANAIMWATDDIKQLLFEYGASDEY